ncbi:YueI family protein [Limosilactobacillus antri]|uniref:YueI family protein n=1 Tax=Limosilactobacillus antri TaxID=227943 RepID=UPI001F562CAF|nr:YueI family protein [Limosilactobacillus antri]
MTAEKKSAVEQRLDNGIYGTPQIKPDEQRRYLGTFRERVCLTISVAELHEQSWAAALAAEFKRGYGQLVFLNGNLPHEEIRPYVRAAAQAGVSFTMKTDPEFKTDPRSLAVVVAAKEAVYQSPVDVKKRYPQLVSSGPATKAATKDKQHGGFFYRLFHREGQ